MADEWERPDPDDDFGVDARIRRLENDAAAGDHEARAELLRSLAKAGIRSGWAFVWDYQTSHVVPADGAIRVDVWASPDASQPRRRLSHNSRGSWAIAALDLADLFRILQESPVFAKGWLVDVSTGAALVTAGVQRLEPLAPLEVSGGIQGQLTDFLEEAFWSRPQRHMTRSGLRATFGVDDLRSLVAQAVSSRPAAPQGLSWAWARSISGAATFGSFFVIAVRTPASVVVGVPRQDACGIAPGFAHEHSGRVRRDAAGASPYEVFVSQPPPANGGSCPACGWTPAPHVVLERDRSHVRLAEWVGLKGADRIRLGLAEAAAWAGVQAPAGSVA